MATFEMDMIPQEMLVFSGLPGKPVLSLIRMGNDLGKLAAFKVKASHEEEFQIDPSVGLIEPGDGEQINVTMKTGKGVEDRHISVSYLTLSAKPKSPQDPWKNPTTAPIETKLEVVFEVEKKDEEKDMTAEEIENH